MEPLEFRFELSEFDLNLLSIDKDLLKADANLLREAVKTYFSDYFRKLGGDLKIASDQKFVKVSWVPASPDDPQGLMDFAGSLLTQGAYKQAEPILESLANRIPENPDIHFNYGMMLSDQGLLTEAIRHLSTAVSLSPDYAAAWNALGIAYHRKGDPKKAIEALERSFALDPQNPHTLRNLGGILAKEDPDRGLPYFAKAVELFPGDQQTLYGYGLCLAELARFDEANETFRKAMNLSPHTQIAELCRQERSKIAAQNLRNVHGGRIRMDAVMYCLSAMETFAKQGPEARQRVTFEIALLGRNGLDINDTTPKYTLSSLPGEFSGLQLASYMYVGFQQMSPEVNTGIDLSREYEAALSLFDSKSSK